MFAKEFTKLDAADRRLGVRTMFEAIAPRYDLLNCLLSLGLDRQWRRLAARCASLVTGDKALDICGGTGDLGIELRSRVGKAGTVIVSDFTPSMLLAGREKMHNARILPIVGDALALPFGTGLFDAVTVGFGLRNVVDPGAGLIEMARVIRPGGRVVVLEMAEPLGDGAFGRLLRAAYLFYFRRVLPIIGNSISGNDGAYKYLPESVVHWASRSELQALMEKAGLIDVRIVNCTLGVVAIHVGTKPTPKTDRKVVGGQMRKTGTS